MSSKLKEAIAKVNEAKKIDKKRVEVAVDFLNDLLKSDLDVAKKNEKSVKEVLAMLAALKEVV